MAWSSLRQPLFRTLPLGFLEIVLFSWWRPRVLNWWNSWIAKTIFLILSCKNLPFFSMIPSILFVETQLHISIISGHFLLFHVWLESQGSLLLIQSEDQMAVPTSQGYATYTYRLTGFLIFGCFLSFFLHVFRALDSILDVFFFFFVVLLVPNISSSSTVPMAK